MYKIVPLGEIATISTGFPFKGEFYTDDGTRVVRGENVTVGTLRWDSIKCWNTYFRHEAKYLLKDGDIVIGMDGSRVGKNRAKIKKTDLPLFLAQRVACVRSNQISDQNYIYYLILSEKFEQYVNKIQTGSSIPHISLKQIEEFPVAYPPLDTQRKIGNLLSTLDAKIELNNRINAELEAMAKTLYDYWFVQFDFPDANGKPYKTSGGKMVWNAEVKREVPEGWEVGNLSNFSLLQGGGTPKTTQPAYWDGEYPFFTPRDVEDNIFVLDTKLHITESGLDSCSSKLFKKGTIFITARGTVGRVNIAARNMAMNQSCYAVVPKLDVSYCFLHLYVLEQVKSLQAKSAGSIFDAIVSNDFTHLKSLVPPIELANEFGKTATPIYEQILILKQQNQKLAELRDWLLPMLMNGQVRVGEQKQSGYTLPEEEGYRVAAESAGAYRSAKKLQHD